MEPASTHWMLGLYSMSSWAVTLGGAVFLFLRGWMRGASVLVLASLGLAFLQGSILLMVVSVMTLSLLLILVFLRAASAPGDE